jgi:hypothetical protein
VRSAAKNRLKETEEKETIFFLFLNNNNKHTKKMDDSGICETIYQDGSLTHHYNNGQFVYSKDHEGRVVCFPSARQFIQDALPLTWKQISELIEQYDSQQG